jgi:hypothetical protein
MEKMIPITEISQDERRRILEEDKLARKASTYFAQAQSSLNDDAGGRFGSVTKSSVTGSGPVVYPRLPADAPSNQLAMTPPEPAIGYDINAQEPTGEWFEIQKSLAPSAMAASKSDGVGDDRPAPVPHVSGSGPVTPQFRRRV